MSNLVLITGATAGIGEATALKLAEAGMNLVITGRRKDRLEKLKKEIVTKYHVEVDLLAFDIQNRTEVEKAFDNYSKSPEIEVLVNNAGLSAGLSPLHEGDVEDWERMIDTNIKGLLYVSRKITPYMVGKRSGHIVNIGSIAGRNVYVNGNVYCATKSAVDALTQGMRADLLPYGIKVSQVAPGAVETEFSVVRFHGDEKRAAEVYKGFEPLIASDIADAIHYIITRPKHVNINDMLIMPTAQACAYYLHKNG
ncbi:MAG: SDR family NAD(P)-dependent oxidoreductase [Bacteroidales bacterium]